LLELDGVIEPVPDDDGDESVGEPESPISPSPVVPPPLVVPEPVLEFEDEEVDPVLEPEDDDDEEPEDPLDPPREPDDEDPDELLPPPPPPPARGSRENEREFDDGDCGRAVRVVARMEKEIRKERSFIFNGGEVGIFGGGT
jgi:hypothetical protein